jgi:hypothetical protein
VSLGRYCWTPSEAARAGSGIRPCRPARTAPSPCRSHLLQGNQATKQPSQMAATDGDSDGTVPVLCRYSLELAGVANRAFATSPDLFWSRVMANACVASANLFAFARPRAPLVVGGVQANVRACIRCVQHQAYVGGLAPPALHDHTVTVCMYDCTQHVCITPAAAGRGRGRNRPFDLHPPTANRRLLIFVDIRRERAC